MYVCNGLITHIQSFNQLCIVQFFVFSNLRRCLIITNIRFDFNNFFFVNIQKFPKMTQILFLIASCYKNLRTPLLSENNTVLFLHCFSNFRVQFQFECYKFSEFFILLELNLFMYVSTYIHNWPLQPFSQDFDLASHTTHVVILHVSDGTIV